MSAILRRETGAPAARVGEDADRAAALPAALAPAPLWHRAVALVLKALLPCLFLAAAAWGWSAITATGPAPERRATAAEPPLVQVATVRAAGAGPTIAALARAEVARRVALAAPRDGLIERVAPGVLEAGLVDAGETAIALAPGALAHELAAAEARVAQVEARIALEAGQAARAARDFERLTLDVTPEQQALILREPQRAELAGERDAALAEVARVRARLEQRLLAAPFDAVVTEARAVPGQRAAAGETLATLVARDTADIVLTVPVPDLAWIAPGDRVRLARPGVWPEGRHRMAEIRRIGATLGEGGTLAEVVARLDDPLALDPATDGPPVRFGAWLAARIEKPAIPGTVEIARAHLREGARVWVVAADGIVEARAVEVLWADRSRALIGAGLAPGERIVATPLAYDPDGQRVRLADTARAGGGEGTGKAAGDGARR